MALVFSDTQSPGSRLSRNGQPIILDEQRIRERESILCAALDLKTHNPVPFLVEPFSMWCATEDILIVVHSCGNVVHNLSTILETESLRGIDITLPHNDINRVAEIAAGRTALMLRYWVQDWREGVVPDLEQYTEQALSVLGTRGILLEMQVPSGTLIEAQELAGRLKSREWLAT